MTYHVQFTPQALEDLSQVDTPIAKRIAAKIQWFGDHYDQIQPEMLTGSFSNLFKLRVGHWRVLKIFPHGEKQKATTSLT